MDGVWDMTVVDLEDVVHFMGSVLMSLLPLLRGSRFDSWSPLHCYLLLLIIALLAAYTYTADSNKKN